MYNPIRGGTRGGQGDFKWSDVAADKDRENYLGHSLNAPVGRWQNGKDLTWYNKEGDKGEEARRAEIRKIKEQEEDALAVALGFAPIVRNPEASTSTAEADDLDPNEAILAKAREKEARRAEKDARKADRAAKREEREKERAATGGGKSRRDDRERDRRDGSERREGGGGERRSGERREERRGDERDDRRRDDRDRDRDYRRREEGGKERERERNRSRSRSPARRRN